MSTGNLDALATHLLDQHWMQAEDFVDELSMLAGQSPAALMSLIAAQPQVATLIKKACAMVAEQARKNQRERESQ